MVRDINRGIMASTQNYANASATAEKADTIRVPTLAKLDETKLEEDFETSMKFLEDTNYLRYHFYFIKKKVLKISIQKLGLPKTGQKIWRITSPHYYNVLQTTKQCGMTCPRCKSKQMRAEQANWRS